MFDPPAHADATDLVLRLLSDSLAAVSGSLRSGSCAVIEPVDLFLYLGRETDSMQFVTPPQTAHSFTDLADFAQPGMGITILDIDASTRLDTFGRVVTIVRNIARAIFDEIIFREEAALDDYGASRLQKLFPLVPGHVEIDGLKKPSTHKALA